MFEKVNPCHPDKVADRIAGALVDYAYDFSFEKCFVCRHCKYDLDKRLHYCKISKEVIDNPHAGRCVNYQR